MIRLEFGDVHAEVAPLRGHYDLVLGVNGTLQLYRDAEVIGVAEGTPLVELRVQVARWLGGPMNGDVDFETVESDDFSLLRARRVDGGFEVWLDADPQGVAVVVPHGELATCLETYCAAVDAWVTTNLGIDVAAFLRRHRA